MPEPEKQFALVERHISRIRSIRNFILSEVVIMVERNLGYATPRIAALRVLIVLGGFVFLHSGF